MVNKRIYLILAGIVILIALGISAFVLAVKKTRENKPQETSQQSQGQLKLLADEEVVSPVPSVSANAIWYFTPKGRLFRVNVDSTDLTEYPLPSINGTVKRVDWALSGNDFILTSTQNGQETKYYYSDNDKKYSVLPKNIQNFDWLPDGRRIVYIWRSGDNLHQQLAFANADASGFKIVTDKIFWPDFKVIASPDGEEVLLIRSQIEGSINKIYKANLATGQIEIVISEGRNLDALWLNSGQKFIFVQTGNSGQARLFLYNLSSRSQTDLNLSATLDKVIVDPQGKYLYAAQPKTNDSSDAILKLDLATLAQEVFFDPEEDLRARNLNLAGDKVFFVNARDGKLYVIQK